jgi:hypothetical protein
MMKILFLGKLKNKSSVSELVGVEVAVDLQDCLHAIE